jgi:hypothetical protein
MDADTAKKLREPFPAEVIGKLPKPTCKACTDNKRDKHCDRHQRQKCRVCGNYITTAHVDLDYVGHAAITDRLLSVDPGWSWEPVAFDPAGLPARDGLGGLWIRLTVAGTTRLGYGDAEGKNGPSAVKEAIGDALRNAAMRFGVGLDLWHKDGQLVHDDEPAPAQSARNGTPQPPSRPPVAREALEELAAVCTAMGYDRDLVAALYAAEHDGANLRAETDAARVRAFVEHLDEVDPTRIKAPAANGASA